MEQIKLSIVIPTYNGAGYIEDTLVSVLRQINEYRNNVELIVRDNCSTDHLYSIVSRLNEQYSGVIKYYRRQSTVKADINFREAILLSQGEYVLLLGDDDLLFPNYIRTVLELIKKNSDFGLFYFNRISTTRDYDGARLKHTSPNAEFHKEYESALEFIADYTTGPDFMSVNVVKRECLIKGLDYAKEEYYGVEWYSSILYGLRGYKCMALFSPMILQRAPKKRIWDDRAMLYVVVGMDNMFNDLNNIYSGIYDVWRKYREKNISKLWYIVKCIPLNRKLYRDKYKELSDKLNPLERFSARCIITVPITRYFFRFIYLINKFLKNTTHLKSNGK